MENAEISKANNNRNRTGHRKLIKKKTDVLCFSNFKKKYWNTLLCKGLPWREKVRMRGIETWIAAHVNCLPIGPTRAIAFLS